MVGPEEEEEVMEVEEERGFMKLMHVTRSLACQGRCHCIMPTSNIGITGQRVPGWATQSYDKPGRCFLGHVTVSGLFPEIET